MHGIFVLGFASVGSKVYFSVVNKHIFLFKKVKIVQKTLKMQCEEYECEASTSKAAPVREMELSELDKTLHELGMLSTITESRREYLAKLNSAKRPIFNLVEMNTRFVSSVSIGLRMKSVTPHLRMKPYSIPIRQRGEERHRTRSENADATETPPSTSLVASVIDAVISVATDEVQNIKKSKSLENVHLENPSAVATTSETTLPEVELVSTCIQKLKMAE